MRSDVLRVPLKLHNLICGRKRAGLQPIIEETATNIYFPSPFGDLSSVESGLQLAVVTDGSATPLLEELAPPIYITGEPVNVTRVKEMLNKLATQKVSSYYIRKQDAYHPLFLRQSPCITRTLFFIPES